jgi:hypothetical protein
MAYFGWPQAHDNDVERPCDLANALALPPQDPDLHRFLHYQHEVLRSTPLTTTRASRAAGRGQHPDGDARRAFERDLGEHMSSGHCVRFSRPALRFVELLLAVEASEPAIALRRPAQSVSSWLPDRHFGQRISISPSGLMAPMMTGDNYPVGATV